MKALLLSLLLACASAAYAQQPAVPPPPQQQAPKDQAKPIPALPPPARYDYQGEATAILQQLFRFHSPYQGPNSLASRNEAQATETATWYLGAVLVPNVEVYINPELALGNGLTRGTGLAGFTDGDLIGQGTLSNWPYLARYFVRWRIPMRHLNAHAGGEQSESEQVGRAPNLIAGKVRAHRLVIQAGKMAVTDVFDTNAYANNPRTQFMNNAFVNNLAYDYAQDGRGYGPGVTAAWMNPDWSVRAGVFAMPTAAGGSDFAFDPSNQYSTQLEYDRTDLRLLPNPKPPLTVRLLVYRNAADMGDYRDAIAMGQQMGTTPDITATERAGTAKYGLGINFEQPLADGGNTGIFGRWGWNDGASEDYMYTECDRFLSLGAQVAGARWRRKDDRVGIAGALSGLSDAHRDYLAAGGTGFVLGDGRLSCGNEETVEAYYLYQANKRLAATLDLQHIANPGFNGDRGPITVLSARVHLAF